jgi:hypothetical protein
MRYNKRTHKTYSPAAKKWIIRAFRQKRSKQKRFLVHYEAIVKGETVTDALYVLARSEKEALLKARNVVKSFHPNAKGIAVAVKEEHTITPR